ncbi:DUF4235 domain-containing protein [Streptomyces xiangluensis]|uniref:DUF4235 domain-containing protein n=1 Tax=Streptomyces xiangluensis TaxID=2665720 RepID=A0ABV8Z5E1_9ACTN
MKASKFAYKPVGMAMGRPQRRPGRFGVKAGLEKLGHEEDAPDATDEHRTWREVVSAAVVQGAIFAGVKAVVDRGGAVATRRLTGTWPG